MPIVVRCEHCSAHFQVRDVYAGKRGKCLRCRQPVLVPPAAGPVDTPESPSAVFRVGPVEPPTRVVARQQEEPPPAEPTPQVVWPTAEPDVELTVFRYPSGYDEPPAPSPGPFGYTAAGDRAVDDSGEVQLGTLRRDGHAAPKRPSNARQHLLGLLLAALVVCVGGFAAVWFVLIAPGRAKATATAPPSGDPTDQQPPPPTDPEPPPPGAVATGANLAKLRAGMTGAEVEAVLGRGKQAKTLFDIATAVSGVPEGEDASGRWNGKVKLGHVWVWNNRFDEIAVAYSDDPDAGGTVVGLVGTFGRSGSEPLKLPDPAAPNPNAKPVDPKGLPGYPEVALTSAELAKDHAKWAGKWVAVTGKLKRDVPPLADGDVPTGAGVALVHQGLAVEFAGAACVGRAGAKAGTEVEVWGKVDGLNADRSAVVMSDCLFRKPAVEVEATAVMDEFERDGPAAVKRYELQPLKVSGVVADAFGKVLVGSKAGDKGVQVHCDALDDKALNLRPGDQVVVLTNHLKFFRDDNLGSNQCVLWGGRVIALKR